ncbi:membrane-bound PQQ-dependent dehydrogenase, glucose/quinate/shikimate family [Kushneria aurantia]|uniref:Membrane-bound PQQ-dependent dehydrogenase, glucose/quinate/shikimate family n=1 Tax=Kushneria aurantia TaxID=504092 RepID=A0ABV6G3D2_9GAMM|nr:membrane-bound PQQ-dependent dehydrogenase, glucose/quinate/shikimate family [Kushneria aurantia]
MSVSNKRSTGTLLALIVGILVALSGIAIAGGGLYLVILGGSWYYLIAGVAMLIAAIQLMRGRMSGAWIFALVLIGTFLWTAWESGLNYWRWIPRLDLVLILAILVALVTPALRDGPSQRAGFSAAGVLFLGLVVAGALAFVPGRGYDKPGNLPAVADNSYATDVGSAQPADVPERGDWSAYGQDSAATRYSSLDQITAQNVGNLQVAWQYQTGDVVQKGWGTENTPLKVGDDVFVCTGHDILISLDAASGKENWRYDPGVSDKSIPYTAACRGLVYYRVPDDNANNAASQSASGDGASNAAADQSGGNTSSSNAAGAQTVADDNSMCRDRIIVGTLDARLIEVDAHSGEPCSGFGNNGQVSITDHMGEVPQGYVSISGVPVVVRNVLITGHEVIDGQSNHEPSGVIKGFDVVTGKELWAWDAANPDHSEPLTGDATYPRASPNMWTTAVGDSKLGMVYLPMGNALPDYWSSSRTEAEKTYSSGLVALNVETGLPAWHFQTAHNDVWDYDEGAQPTLINFPTGNGERVPALILPTKQAEIYVLDRRTGKPLGGGAEERKVPQGGAEPDQRAATQPFSLYANLRFPDLTARDTWGMTPFDQLYCRIQFERARYDGPYTPPMADQPYIEYPSYNGGSDWGSVAVDPQRGVIIANYNNMAMYDQLISRGEVNQLGWKTRAELNQGATPIEGAGAPQVGAPYGVEINAGWRNPYTGLLCTQPPYGGIRAIDLASGKTLWDRPLGTARANGPWGIESGLPINIGTPNNGGSVVTAGGLIFIAAATDNLFRAIDMETGKTVWSVPLPAGGQASPIVYEANGREYVMIRAAGHHFMHTPKGDYVIAYALPQSGSGA